MNLYTLRGVGAQSLRVLCRYPQEEMVEGFVVVFVKDSQITCTWVETEDGGDSFVGTRGFCGVVSAIDYYFFFRESNPTEADAAPRAAVAAAPAGGAGVPVIGAVEDDESDTDEVAAAGGAGVPLEARGPAFGGKPAAVHGAPDLLGLRFEDDLAELIKLTSTVPHLRGVMTADGRFIRADDVHPTHRDAPRASKD